MASILLGWQVFVYIRKRKKSIGCQLEIISSYIPNIATHGNCLRKHRKVVIVQTGAQYQKQTYRNRTTIAGANGILNLSIPINRNPKELRLKDKLVTINYDEQWQNNHWKSFKSAYSSSPFFEFYEDDLKGVFFNKKSNLIDFNISLINLFMEWCEIEVKISINNDEVIPNPTSSLLISSKYISPLSFPKYTQVFYE